MRVLIAAQPFNLQFSVERFGIGFTGKAHGGQPDQP